MSLMKSATRGVFWSGISQFSTQMYQFIVIIVLARLLYPEDFGIIGMAVIFTGLVQTINELGLSAAIIQKKNINDNHLSTSFWISLGLGISLFITTVIISPYIADFFKNELVGPVVSVLSIGFIFGSCSVVHRSLLQKNIEFKKIAITEIVASVMSGSLSIILALFGFGVWSLVFGTILSNFTRSVLLWKVCTWRPSMTFDLTSFKELFSFGAHVMGSRFLNYIDSNIDYLLIGKFLSATALGHYTLAYQLSTFPLTRISSIITSVTFPTFSIIQDDNDTLRYAYLKVIKYISTITFPLLAGLIMVAPDFIPIAFGEKWAPMIVPLQILCVAGALKSVGTTVGSILLSKGRSDIQFKWNVFTAIVLPIAILIGIRYGITGVAMAITMMSFLLCLIIQSIANNLINLNFSDYFKALYPATIGSILVIISLLIYQKLSIYNHLDIFSLTSSIIIGVLVYMLVMRIMAKDLFIEIKVLITDMRK
ncbi:Lipopolysaccharide biosynthesis protein WzxC [Methanosarcina lacustris Z-7289]|uniref:Lipopolysaccharide biosynthesis protein WzxC n=1 Tax=Methanosarcina lacustris Z-7289 TaxID=1434111 RepID=A0A0E3S584_9EURY|nr:MOP flippase family protein [Methanosarcina lacustris]AKB76259.1 Lipopolysaccharide biosynthesis protein WzxC [Methanosarcina lacustris Z-7289]